MMFDWAEYLTLAVHLTTAGQPGSASPECRCRCAASRAYYAALCRAATYLSQVIGDDLPDDFTFHEYVISRFRDSGEREWRRVGAWLEELREYRSSADYDASVRNWAGKASASVTRSKGAIDALEAIFNGPPVAA